VNSPCVANLETSFYVSIQTGFEKRKKYMRCGEDPRMKGSELVVELGGEAELGVFVVDLDGDQFDDSALDRLLWGVNRGEVE
jgi:hypothetical protein